MSSTYTLTNVPSSEHVMVLYNNDDDRNNAAVNYINDGLKNGFHCIYASVDVYNSKSSSNISNLLSKINNYNENIERDELRIIDFMPYYKSALAVNFHPFKKLKTELEETLYHRKSQCKKDAILVFADAACFLSYNKHFDECGVLEWWWHETTTEWRQNNQNITIICPHPRLIFNDPLLSGIKDHLSTMHTITVDLNQSLNQNNNKKTKRILIAEPNSDIQLLYTLFRKHYGFSISEDIVENGNKCLEIIDSTQKDNNNDYDLIIIDTHLPDISGFEVARKVRAKLPHKRIILTTTYSLDNISNIIDSIGIKREDVIRKPFSFSELFSVIEER
jgi:CheY-like chemotaxis protein